MKRLSTRNSGLCFGMNSVLRTVFFIAVLFTGIQAAQAQYVNVPVTGFNNDIVANGGGASGTPNTGVTNATVGVDGAGYCLVSQGYTAGSSTPTCFMPTSGTAVSLLTPAVTYTFQGYGTSSVNNNNALTITSPSSTYSSPFPNSATLTLTTPASFGKLYVLLESVVNNPSGGTQTMTATVTFTDATTQVFAGNTYANWFSGSAATTAVYQINRVNPTNGGFLNVCTAGNYGQPSLYELPLNISSANQGKLVQSITFTSTSTSSTGTTPTSVNYLHMMAVSGIAPCAVPTAQVTGILQGATSTFSISGSFVAASPAPSGYLVFRCPNGATPAVPDNGTLYSAGQTFGNATVIQSGSALTFTTNGLLGGVTYDFYVYSYNNQATCGGPVYFTAATNGNNMASFSTSPCGAMSGVVQIGPTAPAAPAGFTNLTNALNYINANGLSGPTYLELQSNYVSTGETYPITFRNNPCIGPANSLTVRPAAGVSSNLVISPTAGKDTAAIRFDGGQYITIDGRPGGVGTTKRLVISNTLTTAISTVYFLNDAGNNTVTFCDIQGASATSANPTTSGVVFFGSTTGANGNDNNTISSCDIHSAGATLPAIGIGANNSTAAGSAANNDNNTITGCNIFDIFSATLATTFIKIDQGNNGYTITNNRFYQTAARTITTAAAYRFIWLNPNSTGANVTYGSGHLVSGNGFGGSNATNTGAAMNISGGTTTSQFLGMDISVGNGGGTLVTNNTFSNIAFTSGFTTLSGPGIFSAISINYGNVSSISNNTIGLAGFPITVTNSGATTNVLVNGIRIGGGIMSQSISGNTISNLTALQSNVASGPTLNAIMINAGTTSPTLSNNNIGPLTVGSSGVTSTSTSVLCGIMINVAVVSPVVTNNTIHDLTNFYPSSNTGAVSSVSGIAFNNTSITTSINVSGNILYNFANAAASTSATFAPAINGIYVSIGATAAVVNGNFIHSFALPNWNLAGVTATGAGSFTGILGVTTTTMIFSNNMIRLGLDGNGNPVTQPISIRGMYRQATNGTYAIWHNSVWIGGTGVTNSSAALQCAAYFRQASTVTADDVRNNIFVNQRTNTSSSSTAKNYVVYVGSFTTAPTFNYNLYQNNGGTGNFFAFNGTTDVQTYSNVTPWIASDVNSLVNDPHFINTTGNATAVNLHLDPSVATAAEGNGITIPSVTTDYDGETRSGLTPVDIGADAGNFIAVPVCTAPAAPSSLVLTPVSNSVITLNFSASSPNANAYLVVRYPAVPAPVEVPPVNGTNYTTGSTLGAGTVAGLATGAGPTISFNATGLAGETSYVFYVYAVNNNCSGSVQYNTASVLTGTATTLACTGLSGTVSIGGSLTPPTSFPTLTSALGFAAVNGLSSSTILELQASYNPASETFPITIGAIPCISATKTLTIRPAAGVNGKVITSAAVATIDFNGAGYVTIDGRPGGVGSNIAVTPAGAINSTNLNIINTNTAGTAIRLDNQSSNNAVRFCDLQGSNTINASLPSTVAGVVFFGNSTGANGNDNNTIDHCNIHSASATPTAMTTLGVYAFGPAGSTVITPSFNDNNVVTDNNIYDYFSPTTFSIGVEVERGCNGWTISNNSFFQTAARTMTNASQFHRAIYVAPSSSSTILGGGFNVTGNFIGGSAPLCSGSPYSIANTNASGTFSVRVIDIAAAGGATNNVKSNTIQNIKFTSNGSGTDLMDAIFISQPGNINIGGPLASDGNIIGSSLGTANIILNNMGAGTNPCNMIFATSATVAPAQILIQNNTIGGIRLDSTGTSFAGITNQGSANVTIDHNLIGSTTIANSIMGTSNGTQPQYVRGINVSQGTSALTITNNTIANLVNSSLNATTAGNGTNTTFNHTSGMYIISTSTAGATITGNTVFNLSSTASTASGGGTGAVVSGIAYYNTSATTPATISSNTVHSLLCNSASTSTTLVMGGIFFTSTSVNHIISKNFVHSLDVAAANPSVTMRGIEILGGTPQVQNNMVRLGIRPNGNSLTTPLSIYGIVKSTATNVNFYHNTVYIGGSGVTTGATNTFAFNRFTAATDDIRDNIFINNRSNSTGTGKHYQISMSANTNLVLNSNIYNGTGTGAVFGFNGTADVPTYSTGWVANDFNSYTDDPLLVNPTGPAATVDLHVVPASTTRVEQFGEAISTVTDDFDSEDRSALTPTDIGADAGNFNPLFVCGGSPVIATATLSNTTPICSSGSKTIILTGISSVPGLSYQWKESTTGLPGSFQKILVNGTLSTYTTPVLTQTMFYLCEVTCDLSQITTPSSVVSVVVNPTPVVTITPPNGSNVCNNALVELTANVSNTTGNTFGWGGNPTGVSMAVYDVYTSATNLQTVISRPTSTTNGTSTPTWTYLVNVTSGAGCPASPTTVTYNVIASTLPQFMTLTTTPDPVCQPGSPVTLTVNNAGTVGAGQWTYKWYDASGATLLQSTTTTSGTDSYTPPSPAVAGLYMYKTTVSHSSCPASIVKMNPMVTVGFTAAKTITEVNCGSNGTITVFPRGQNNFTSWYSNDFSNGIASGTPFQALNVLAFSQAGSLFPTSGNAPFTCRLTDNLSSQNGTLIVRNPNAINSNNLQVDFKITTTPRTIGFSIYGADGMAWSYGPDVVEALLNPSTVGLEAENGSGTGIKLAFDATPNTAQNSVGAYLMYNCTVNDQGPTSPGVLAFVPGSFWMGLTNAPLSVVISEDGYVTVTLNNEILFNNVQLPAAYLAANKSNWIHGFTARAGAASSVHAIDDLNIRYNAYEYSINSTNGTDGNWQASNQFGGLAAGSYNVWVRNPSNPSCVTNTGTVTLVPGTIPAVVNTVVAAGSRSVICSGDGSVLTTDVFVPGASYLWESAPSATGPWSPAAGTNNQSSYITGPLSVSTYYRMNFTCPSSSPVVSTPKLINVNVGTVTSTGGPYYLDCANQTITMTATPASGTTLIWYANPGGGSPLINGNSYTATPDVLPKTYYIEPTTSLFANPLFNGGLNNLSNSIGNTTSGTGQSVRFTANASLIIDSVKVVPNAAGTVTIALQNSLSSTNLQTFSKVVTATDVGRMINVPVNFTITGAGNYQLTSTGTSCFYYSSFANGVTYASFPSLNMGGILVVTGFGSSSTAAMSTSSYGPIFSICINTACPSSTGQRVPVVVGLDPNAQVHISSGSGALCQGATQALVSSSSLAYGSFTWSPATNLFTNAAATIPYAGGNTDTVYIRSLATGTTVYTVTASGSADGCTNTGTSSVVITPAPAVSISSTGSVLCPGASATLTASSVNAGYTYTWNPGGSNAASITVSPSVHSNYTVQAVDNTNGINKGCIASAVQGVGIRKLGVLATADPVSICSGDNSQLGASAFTSAEYTLNASTPSLVPIPGGGVTTLNNTVGLSAGTYNDGYWNVNLPFNFSYFGDLFSSISVNTNGFITMNGGSTASSAGIIPNAAAPNNAIYLAAKDWTMASSGTIRYFTVGAAPNRRFVINYTAIPPASGTGTLNGQIILSEAFGKIELILTGTDASSVKTLGIENGDGSFAYSPGLRNGTSWTISTPESWEFVPLSGNISYAWTPSANLDDPTSATPVAGSIFSTTTFTVTATDALSGCSNSDQETVTTGAALSAVPVATDTVICVGESATLSVNPTGGCSPYTYTWDDGFNILSTSNFANVAPTVTTDYNLTVIDNVSNVYVYTITIHVNPVPVVTVTNGTICGAGSATLTASGATTYSWTPSTGLNTTSGSTVISSATASTLYTVTGTTGGCSATAFSQVNSSPGISVSASATPSQINPNHNAQLNGLALQPGSNYSVLQIPYAQRDTTTLTNSGPSGDEGNANASSPFIFNFFGNGYNAFTIHSNGQVLMGANRTDANSLFYPSTSHTNIPNSANPNNWVGFWADMNPAAGQVTWGVVGTAPNRKLIVRWNNATWFTSGPSPLFYQLELNETTNIIDVFLGSVNGGTTSPSHTRLVAMENVDGTIGYAPTGRTPASGFWSATNEAWRFSPLATGATFSWSPATGLSDPNIANPVAQNVTSTTTYTVTATSTTGCTATSSTTVTVGVPFAVTASSSANNFCQGGSTTLSAVATGGGIPYQSYSWSNGISTVGTGQTISVQPTATTTYTITVSDADNFTASSTITVTVKPNPVINVTKSGDVCGTGSALLTASGTSTSYAWNPSPTLVVNSPGDNATVTPAATTTYGVTGTLNGCSSATTLAVNVFPAVSITASASPTSICFNGSSQLSATPTSGLNFSWTPATFLSSAIVSNPAATNVTSSTTYTVTAVNPVSGCSGTAQVTLQAGAPLSVTASAASNTICMGDSVTLSSVISGGGTPYSYAWKAGAATIGTGATLRVAPSTTTSYTLQVTDACTAVVSSNVVTVTVNSLPPVSASPVSSFLCSGVSTSSTLVASGADTYAWSPVAGLSATTGSSVIASPALSTVYTVTGTSTSTGCKATAMATVGVSSLAATAQGYSYSICNGNNGQLVAYTGNSASNFTLSSIPFASLPVANATTITSWANADIDDGSSGPISLPFSFNFYGTNYNQIYVGTNGYISFSDLSTITGLNSRKAANLTTATAANNVVALCYSDLHAGNGGGSVKYFTSGTAPYRVFVIAFDEVFLTNTGRVQGQIQLYENTNVIEVHVNQINHGTSTSPNALGVENATGTQRMIPASRLPGVWNVSTPEAWRFSPNAGYSFSWTPSAFLSNTNTSNPLVNGITSTTVYTVVATEIASGCQAQDTVKVTAIPLPTATITGDAEICANSSTSLSFAFTGMAPFTYSYTDGTNTFGPFTASTSSATQAVSPSVAKTYTLVSVSDANCTGTTAGSAIVTIDTHAPVINCPAAVTVNTDPGHAYATGVALGTPNVTDNCSFLVSNNAPAAYLLGNTTVVWTATDSHGNTSTCAQTVTVVDNQPPVLTCPSAVHVSTDAGSCFATQVNLGQLDATDNDGVASITNNAPSQYPVGNTTVTWIATDLSGLTSACTQTVNVTDDEDPQITCPAPVSVSTNPGVCYATGISLGTPSTSDNCTVSSVSNNAPVQFPSGVTMVTWTVTDASGNKAQCTQSVTVTDHQAPTLSGCPSNFSSCNPVSWTPPTALDNCTSQGAITITSNYAPGATFPAGTTPVIYTATDGAGNSSTCSFNVTRLEPSSIAGITLTSNKPFDNICLGDNITISMNGIVASSLGAGAQWKWYSGSCGGTPVPGSTNQTSITVSPSASTTYYVRAEGTCNTTACLSLPVTVTTVPPSGTTVIVYSPTFAYAGASDSIVLSPVAGATFYHWTTNGNSNILFDGHTAPYESSSPKVMLTFVSPSTQGNGIGNYHIQFFAGNACGVTSSNNIRVRATVSQPVLASGPLVACTGQTKQYSITALVGAKTYQWSFSSGAGTITGNGTSTVNVTFTSLPAVLCVHGVTANGTPGPDLCLNISTVTAAPGAISGNANPCQGGTETYSISTVAGASSYAWSTTVAGAVMTQNGTSVSVTWPAGAFSGDLCVKTNSGCGFSAATCLSIISGTVPPLGTVTGPQFGVCSASGVNYQVPSTGATTYNWSVPSGATISAGQGTNSILVDFSNSFAGGVITLMSNNSCGLANGALPVTGRPDTAIVAGSVSVCSGDVESYVATSTGAQSYQWDVDPLEGNIIPTANANEIMVEWITNGGTVKVTTSNSCGSTGPIYLLVGSSCRLAGDKAMSDALNAIVFPNPSRGQLTLQFNSPEESNYLLKITDLTGRMMQREDLHGQNGLNSHDIDLTHVAKGMYMLSLQNHAGDTIVIRLVID